jgi:putative membrane protein
MIMIINKSIPIKYLFNKVKVELIYVLIMAVIVYYITHVFQNNIPEMPLTIPAFIGTSISILISFKLNQSYDRWWEARKIWGSIVNDSRSLILQFKQFLPADENINRIAYRQIAWCYALGESLRGLDSKETLKKYLNEIEIEEIIKQSNKPLAIIQHHYNDLKQFKNGDKINQFSEVQLDNTLVRLVDAMGKAERIKSTVFPVTYRLFLHLMIYLFIITLSISLKNIESVFEIPLLLVLSAAFFLLEKSATHMQDPFENRPTDTAVTAIARTIEINIKNIIEDKNIPEKLNANQFYLN